MTAAFRKLWRTIAKLEINLLNAAERADQTIRERFGNSPATRGRETDAAVLCNIETSQNQRIVPMLKAGIPIEDPKPLLDRKEFMENMIIKPLQVSLTED